MLDCLIDLFTFPYSPNRTTRDIVIEVVKLEEVKTLVIVILKLGGVMPHSGVAATLNPNPTEKILPPFKKVLPLQKRKIPLKKRI